jgi:hypothetical protein
MKPLKPTCDLGGLDYTLFHPRCQQIGAFYPNEGVSNCGTSAVSKDAPQWGQQVSLGLTSPPHSEQINTSSAPQAAQTVSFSPTVTPQAGQRGCPQAGHSGRPGAIAALQRGQTRPHSKSQRGQARSSGVSIRLHVGQKIAPHSGQGPFDGTKWVPQMVQTIQRTI